MIKTRYITNEYRVTYLPDGSLQYERLLRGEWNFFSFKTAEDCKSEYDANMYLANS